MTSAIAPGCTGSAESTVVRGTSPQRWLHVMSHTEPRYGGLSSAVPTLIAALGTQEHLEVSLAAFCHAGETFKPAEVEDEAVSFWPTSRVAWLVRSESKTRFARLLERADGVHVHGLWEESTAAACQAARELGKPYIVSAHGMLEPWALNAKRWKKQLYAALVERKNLVNAACLHALTEAEAEQYRQFGAKGPIAVIPNAVNSSPDVGAEPFLQAFPQLRGKLLVLFLSRLHPKKGLDLLIESWLRLSGAFPGAHLVLAGPDSEGTQASLLEVVRRRGLQGTVTFTGMLTGDMKWSAFKAAGGFILPSYSEGLSMALLEAMGTGLPVIATHTCHMPEITMVDAGWEVESTVDAVTTALRGLLSSSREERLAKGINGSHLIATRYSRMTVVRQTMAMYRAVLESVSPQGVHWLPGSTR